MRELTVEEWGEVRAAVALPGWQWMPGMRVMPRAGDSGWRLCGIGKGSGALCTEGPTRIHRDPVATVWRRDPLALPDVRDWATAGCMLGLFGEAVYLDREGDRWWVWDDEEQQSEATADLLGLALCRLAIARGRWGDA